jgi:SNF2 family DNA or RNA helicase
MFLMRVGTRQFPKITGYRNIDELKKRLQGFSSRIMKKECLDLPDKTFSTIYVDLTPEQRTAYDAMRDMCVMTFGDSMVTVTSALTTITKLHQIACGHCLDDQGNMMKLPNNRIDTLLEAIEEILGKIIVWCNFQQDVRDIKDAISNAYGSDSCVTYYGETNNDDRQTAHKRFNDDPTCRFFIATSAASKGLTLVSSHYNIYYSHSYNLENYLQSQDRTHRIGQDHNVHYLSIVAKDTIDEKIVKALSDKKSIADMVMTNWRETLGIVTSDPNNP